MMIACAKGDRRMVDQSITGTAGSVIDAVKLIVTTPKMLGIFGVSVLASISGTWTAVYFVLKNQLASLHGQCLR